MKISEIPEGHVYTIQAPLIQARISGAWKAGFYRDGRVALKYEDNTVETAKFSVEEAQKLSEDGMENWFHIVGEVQGRRALHGR